MYNNQIDSRKYYITADSNIQKFNNHFIGILIAISMMLLTCNKLIAIPLDKVVLFMCVLLYIPGAFKLKKFAFTKDERRLLLALFAVVILSLMANIDQFSFQLVLPIAGFIFSVFLSQSKLLIRGIYYGAFLHIFIADFLGLASYAFGSNPFVSNLAYKGMPMLNSLLGFTPTPQSFGTLCLSWLILYFFFKERNKVGRLDRCFYWMVTLGIFLSVNRTTYIGYLLILFFKQRKLLVFYFGIGIILIVVFWSVLMDTLFNSSTLDAREELLDAFKRSFWDSNSWSVYLFGKGDNKLAEKYIRYATWDNRDDIENGFAMILHMLGFVGLTFYIFSILLFLKKFFQRKYFYESILVLFFCFFSPYITQEFVATTYYVVLGILIFIFKYKNIELNGRSKEISGLG